MDQKLSRRSFLKVLAGAAGASVLAACGGEAPTAGTGQTAPATGGSKQTVRYLGWWFEEGNRGITWNSMVKEFNESQSDIEVKVENIPFDNYATKTIVGVQSGKLDGDVIIATPELAPRLVKSDLLEPLDSVLTKNNITDLSSAHNALRKDGKLYGLDVVTVAFGILYNQLRYDEAGVKPASTPDEWIEVSKALTDRDAQKYGFWSTHLVNEPADFWFTLQEWAMPYDGLWAKDRTPLLTSEPILQGLSLYKQMYDVAMPQGADGPTGQRLFGTGAVAQGLYVSAAVGSLKPAYPETYPNLRSAPLPWASNKSLARIHPIMVNASSSVKDAALEFVNYVYKPDNYRRMVEGCEDVIFAQPSAARQEYLDTLHWLKPGYDGVSYVTPSDLVGEFVYSLQEFGQIVISNFSEVLLGSKSVEDAMANAQKQAEALAERLS
jgi:ABC-type glycerol-3-phosphate transport system substrate-binding protein